MDEEPATSSDTSSSRRCGSRQSLQSRSTVKRVGRKPKSVVKFTPDSAWTPADKSKLLEGFQRYGVDDVDSLSQLLGRSCQEIERMIQRLSHRPDCKKTTAETSGVQESEQVPLDMWDDLVTKIAFYEKPDFSDFIPKVMGVFTRCEEFAPSPSGIPRLNWEVIYKFLTDLLENKIVTQTLSDVESLVVLDLMHSLGATLHTLDTSEQRKALDYKYTLLTKRVDHKQKYFTNVSLALKNETTDTDPFLSGVGADRHVASSSDSISAGPSDEKVLPDASATTDPISSTNKMPHVSSTASNSLPATASVGAANTSDLPSTTTTTGLDSDALEQESLLQRPKHITLNPLCIPSRLVEFRPKGANSK